MRQVGKIPEKVQADRFASYLLTRGIKTHVDQEPDGVLVWAIEEDRIEEARRELQQFREDPQHERYRAAEQQANALKAEALRKEREYARNVIDVRTTWQRPGAGRRPMTVVLIAACVLVAFATNFGRNRDPLISQYLSISSYRVVGDRVEWPVLSEIKSGQVWRLVTPIFIHFGPIHLLFNMLMFYQLAVQVEVRKGKWHLLALVIVIAAISNMAQYEWSGPRFGGMSGVVYGLLGYIWMKSRFDRTAGMFLAPSFVVMALVWLALGTTGRVGPIANAAHIGGLVSGIVLGYAPILWRDLKRGR